MDRLRLKTEPSLAPSYRILFDNVDNAVNNNGFPNPFPIHLKCIAISGLPVDDIPCVEVWDVEGSVYSSHVGMSNHRSCTWSPDYGDGFFRINKDIIGDFSIMCRFGGKHAATRDKTTLIFKYQNNTGFLPTDVVELKRQNVDVNPEYAEHIDADMFVLHITFEQQVGELGRKSLSYHSCGRDAFDAGLDEISKHHIVEPDSDSCREIINMGCESSYATISLQLANNNKDAAEDVAENIRKRILAFESTPIGAEIELIKSAVPAKGGDQIYPHDQITTVSRSIIHCVLCQDLNDLKQDQLIQCINCLCYFHTHCVGTRRIPFGLKSEKERMNHEKYVLKFYGTWCCSSVGLDCVPRKALSPEESRSLNQSLSFDVSKITDSVVNTIVKPGTLTGSRSNMLLGNDITENSRPHTDGEISNLTANQLETKTPMSSKNDQAAHLIGLLAKQGITMEELVTLGEERQRELLINVAQNGFQNQSVSSSQVNGSQSSASEEVKNETHNVVGGHENGEFPVLKLKNDPRFSKYLKMVKVGLPKSAVAEKMMSEGVVSSLQDGIQILEMDPEGNTPFVNSASSVISVDATDVRPQESLSLKDHPIYSKYFKMLKVGLAKEAVQAKMRQEGVDPLILDKDPEQFIDTIATENKNEDKDLIAFSDHPIYSKYFKMLKVGLSKETVKAKMQQEGHDPSILDKSPDEKVPKINESNTSGAEELVPVNEHPMYAKYFKMLKVGLPKENVKAKMQQDGIDPSFLDKNPTDKIPLKATQVVAEKAQLVPAEEHPSYAKYFKMLKVGISKDSVKAKMKLEGVDPDIIDKGPKELIALELKPTSSESKEAMIAVQDHPLFAKYFKMIKVGLAKDAVKAKMSQEGVDPTYIDKDPKELVPVSLSKAGKESGVEPAVKGPQLRKKRLHWRAIDPSKVGKGTLWGDKDVDEDIQIDEAEFQKFFVESTDTDEKRVSTKPVAQEAKKQRINLIDMKRGQNAGIALARIRMSFEEVKSRIMQMDDHVFSTDQLRSLEEYLPSPDEAAIIKAFKGDFEMLGQAEKYMSVMTGFNTAAKRIKCMIFKQQFKHRVIETKAMVVKIENACVDVIMSIRLKKVLKTILRVGNQLNDGADHAGFTVDSLLKLQSAKAFDKKTSVLQYVIMLIYRNDKSCLHFTEDLSHVPEASRIVFDSILSERSAIKQGMLECSNIFSGIREASIKTAEDSCTATGFTAMEAFLEQVHFRTKQSLFLLL